jgi:Rrf2 family protein
MLLTKTCSYGIRAAIYIATQNYKQYVPIKEIAKTLNISFHFLTKILQILTKEGIIDSVKGPGGGVGLSRKSGEITILDIIHAVDGNNIFDECVLGLPGCSDNNPCPMHGTWGVLRKDLFNMLQKETLEDLATQVKNKIIQLYE